MEFASDIALGKLTEADLAILQDEVRVVEQQVGNRFGLPFSFFFSVVIHAVLASTILYSLSARKLPQPETVARTIQIEFLSIDSLLEQEEELPAERVAAPTETVEPQELVSQDSSPEPATQELAPEGIDATVSTESIADTREPRLSPSVTAPTVENLREAIVSLQRSDASNFYTSDCNALEEERELISCNPRDDRDYTALTRNPVYDFHNPALEISRSQETVTTLARQSAGVSAALSASNLPAGLSAYVLEEIEQGIETHSNRGNRALTHMNTMIDKSFAGEEARRINTPWVQQQSAVLRSRRVEDRTTTRMRNKCRGIASLLMVPSDYAECLRLGESPLGFSIEF